MKQTMKTHLALILAAVLALMLCACTGGTPAPSGGTQPCRIAIIKQLDHASLDEIAAAVAARLEELKAQGFDVEYTISSGQNDPTVLRQLCDQAVADRVDVMIPIATTAAQVAAVAAEGTGIRVVYAAVSDPVTARLTGLDYVCGTSDALNTRFVIDMMLAQNPELKSVGLLYSLSEPNSAAPIAEAREHLAQKGIACIEQTANTNDEVVAAAAALIAAGVDAVFTPTDNVIMAAELAIYEDLIAAGIPHYAGADSFVRSGAFATCGVNYTDLGRRTAELARQLYCGEAVEGLSDGRDYLLLDGGIITVNTQTAAGLGADYSAFAAMGTVVEVTTGQD